MTRAPVAVLAALAVLATVLGAGFQSVMAQEDDPDREIREREKEFLYILDTGEQGRLELLMEEGGFVNWVIRSGNRPIEFHMFHLDDGEQTSHVGPKRLTSDSKEFTAQSDGVYVFLTERELDREATVRLTIWGEYGIQSTEGMDQAREVPGPAVVPWIVGLLVLGGIRWQWARTRRT